MDMEHKEFIDYMIKRGVKEDLLTFMKDMGMDGPHWRMAISDANSTQVKEDIEEQGARGHHFTHGHVSLGLERRKIIG